jgi:hypothetical protein
MQQMNQLVTSLSATLDEMEWDRRKCRSSLGDCIHQFEQLKSGSSLWMCRLDLLQQAISYDPDMVIALAFYSNISKLAHTNTHRHRERERERERAMNICIYQQDFTSTIINSAMCPCLFFSNRFFFVIHLCVCLQLCSLQITLFFFCSSLA